MRLNLQQNQLQSFEDVRDALQNLEDFLRDAIILKGEFSFFEITFNKAVDRLTYSHKLNFIPKDIIQLSVNNGAQITWHYDEFGRDQLVISSNGPCTVRAYVGRHKEVG